jgi:transposase-like protein
MVRAVRDGEAMRAVARHFSVSVSTVSYWVEHARGQPLARVDFTDRKPGRAWNRTPASKEAQILRTRIDLRKNSVLGECGAEAIANALLTVKQPIAISRATIYRVLERRGALDAVRRQRRPAPPKGWYLPRLASGEAELDSFDFIEDLKIDDGPLVCLLTGISLHGALADAWVMRHRRTTSTIEALLGRWRADGLPDYAQFDNDNVFQGAHHHPDAVGRVTRLCLALGVIPVFAPPREPGLQNAIEGFNGLWQSKVWQRHHCATIAALRRVSATYIKAHRVKTAHRRDDGPARRRVPKGFTWDATAPLRGSMIFIRRSDEHGAVNLLARGYPVDQNWPHRLVRCEVDFTHQSIRFYALRRRDPDVQPLLHEVIYSHPSTRRKATK